MYELRKEKLHREIYNTKLLFKLFFKYDFSIGYWSLVDGITRRLGLEKFYEKTHYRRYEACKSYLRKKYGHVIDKYRNLDKYSFENIHDDECIWRFWYQGKDKLPYPVNLCVESVERHAKNHSIRFVDESNYSEYIKLPQYVQDKIDKGTITIAHISDFIRVGLLKKYGGIWLDSTFFLTSELPKEITTVPFYSICAKNERKWVVSKDLWSVGMMSASGANSFIDYCWDFMQEYMKNEDDIICYLLLDCMMAIGYEDVPEFKRVIDMIPANNRHTFSMLNDTRNKKYDRELIEKYMSDTYIFQLTYKLDYISEINGELTNFGRIIQS